MLGTYVNLELVNPLTKRTLLVIEQIQDVFNTSTNKVSSPSVNVMQDVQELSEEVLDFKTRRLA